MPNAAFIAAECQRVGNGGRRCHGSRFSVAAVPQMPMKARSEVMRPWSVIKAQALVGAGLTPGLLRMMPKFCASISYTRNYEFTIAPGTDRELADIRAAVEYAVGLSPIAGIGPGVAYVHKGVENIVTAVHVEPRVGNLRDEELSR